MALSRREAWGYAVWLTAAIVVSIPEIAAGVSDMVPWPTISETVGHLEAKATWFAPIVVMYLVFVAYHAVGHLRFGPPELMTDTDTAAPPPKDDRPPRPAAPAGGRGRTQGGRLTMVAARHPAENDTIAAGWFAIFGLLAIAVVIAGTAVAANLSSDRYVAGYVLYSLLGLFWVLVPTVLAYWFKKDVPFPPLSVALAYLERRVHVVAVLVLGALVALMLHLAFYPWPDLIRDLQNLHHQRGPIP